MSCEGLTTESPSLRVAVVGPFDENVPLLGDTSLGYGGIERVLSGLVYHLDKEGHDVTLFASGGSGVPEGAKLFECTSTAIRHMKEASDPEVRMALSRRGLERAIRHISEQEKAGTPYDVVHFNYGPEWLPPLLRDEAGITTPCVTTFHGPLSQPKHQEYFGGKYKHEPVISISYNQRGELRTANYVNNVHNGVGTKQLELNEEPGDHFVFLGRMNPDKGPEDAINIAVATDKRLIMAAKIDPNPDDQAYYRDRIKPLLKKHKGQVEFIGEITDAEKSEFLGSAEALLAPVALNWREPFGLVYAEANACGTPVVARPHGSLSEVIAHGTTGLLYTTIEEMISSVNGGMLKTIQRAACRERVERLFSYPVMTKNYLTAYQRVIDDFRVPIISQQCAIVLDRPLQQRRPLLY